MSFVNNAATFGIDLLARTDVESILRSVEKYSGRATFFQAQVFVLTELEPHRVMASQEFRQEFHKALPLLLPLILPE